MGYNPGERCCVNDRGGHVICIEHAILDSTDLELSLRDLCERLAANYGDTLRPLLEPFDHCRVSVTVPPLRATNHAGPQPRKVFALTFTTNLQLAKPLLDSAAEYNVPLNVRGTNAL